MQAGFWRRHRWLKWVGGGLLAALAVLTGAVLVVAAPGGADVARLHRAGVARITFMRAWSWTVFI